jgi:hypothetical protein
MKRAKRSRTTTPENRTKTTAAIDKLKTDMDELSERELEKASGGLGLNYGEIKWTYTPHTPQKPD